MSFYAKESLAVYFALDMVANIQHSLGMLDTKTSPNRQQGFQTKSIPPSLRNALDRVLSFDIILGLIPGKANHAAYYLERILLNSKTKLTLRINSKIPISEVYIDTTAEAADNLIHSCTEHSRKILGNTISFRLSTNQIKQKSVKRFIFNN